jgi:putative ABC transport system ATP-binding protein
MSIHADTHTNAEKPASKDAVAPVTLRHVTKTFRQGQSVITAIQDVSLTIEQGEFVAIMGASGSGKSTLLHLMSGLTSPDSGDVRIDGVDLSRLSDAQLTRFRREKIGLVFQAFNLIPTLSAEENVLLPALVDGRKLQHRQSVEYLLERLGLRDRRNHRPDSLSGGEQQRVAIARALISDPAAIFADEPTGSLDSVTGQRICQLLQELCVEYKKTIVVVTHEPSVALWASRVMVMKDGRVLTEFPTSDFSQPNALASHYQNIVNRPHIDPASADSPLQSKPR